MSAFLDRLDTACLRNRSLVCVGLDPDPALMPVADVFAFNRAIVDATRDLVCAYKPNMAFYEALGLPGLEALVKTVRHIRNVAPGVVVLGDAKRGDVGNTALAYARACFEAWDFDAVTVSPYLGRDGVQPFLDYEDRGVFVLCRTSNPGAKDFQDLSTGALESDRPTPLYLAVARTARQWNAAGNVGLVLGATYPDELCTVRDLCPDLPFLIPGVGAQEGAFERSVRCGVTFEGRRALINSSRAVIYASGDGDYAEAARTAAAQMREAINGILEAEGKGWS